VDYAKDSFQKRVTALYAKILIILGLAFPLSEVLSDAISSNYYQIFYVYLMLASLLFLIFFYCDITCSKRHNKVVNEGLAQVKIVNGEQEKKLSVYIKRAENFTRSISSPFELNSMVSEIRTHSNFGSFYLRLGTILFGIGSLIHTGIEVGGIFEIENISDNLISCGASLNAVRPFLQLVFIFCQMYFIFLNQKMNIYKRKFISRLGLMHMIATNICIWIKVVILETKHEIFVSYHGQDPSLNISTVIHATDYIKCGSDIMQKVLEDSSTFLFPCTIEFSLICAAILFIMWKNVGREHVHYKETRRKLLKSSADSMVEKRSQHYSVDCSHANTGMFCGILILVIIIISLIIFFVFISNSDPLMQNIAVQVASISELFLYSLTSVAVLIGMFRMRGLWYDIGRKIELDNFLLIIAQTGVIIYATFSVVGTFFQFEEHMLAFFSSLAILVQTLLQTTFILDASCRFVTSEKEVVDKPGRQVVTFLLVCNLAMWMMNTLETNRADSHPIQAEFFGGHLAWPIITHISMPLAIFYRFHSTVCLFEIWKKSFKYGKRTATF